eukprot:7429762-Pyramimonas_sp.AAC.1
MKTHGARACSNICGARARDELERSSEIGRVRSIVRSIVGSIVRAIVGSIATIVHTCAHSRPKPTSGCNSISLCRSLGS